MDPTVGGMVDVGGADVAEHKGMDQDDFTLNPEDCVVESGPIPAIRFSEQVMARLHRPWSTSLIIKVMGPSHSFNFLEGKLKNLWGVKGAMSLIEIENNFYIVRFDLEEDMHSVLFGGPWFVGGQNVVVQRWKPGFNPHVDKVSHMAVWVRVSGLGVEFFNHVILSKIGELLGCTLLVDRHALSQSRGKFARICVEIDLNKPLVPFVEVAGRTLSVTYEGITVNANTNSGNNIATTTFFTTSGSCNISSSAPEPSNIESFTASAAVTPVPVNSSLESLEGKNKQDGGFSTLISIPFGFASFAQSAPTQTGSSASSPSSAAKLFSSGASTVLGSSTFSLEANPISSSTASSLFGPSWRPASAPIFASTFCSTSLSTGFPFGASSASAATTNVAPMMFGTFSASATTTYGAPTVLASQQNLANRQNPANPQYSSPFQAWLYS